MSQTPTALRRPRRVSKYSLAVAAGLALALGGAVAPAAHADSGNCVGTNATDWASFKTAYDSAGSDTTFCLAPTMGTTITATSGQGLITPNGVTHTIDLNGYTLNIPDPGSWGSGGFAAIEVQTGSGLVVTDSSASANGTLNATGGDGPDGTSIGYGAGAGIGGRGNSVTGMAAGSITIRGGDVNANGGYGGSGTNLNGGGGAGIGGGGGTAGNGGDGGTVTIDGGRVTAAGGGSSPGRGANIGGGATTGNPPGGSSGTLLIAGNAPKPTQTPVSLTDAEDGKAPSSIGQSTGVTQPLTWALTINSSAILRVEFGSPTQVAPTNVQPTPGDMAVDLTWDPVTSTPAVTGYYVEYREANQTPAAAWTSNDTSAEWSSTTPTRSVSGLTNGTVYEFRVSAISNDFGAGVPSDVVTATPGTPAAPTNLQPSPGDEEVALTWTASTSTGSLAATGYEIQYRETGATSWITQAVSGGATVSADVPGIGGTPLVNGTEYEFRIAATNATGTGSWSDIVSSTPSGAPAAPAPPTVDPGDGEVTVNWTAPSDGGSPISGYQIQYRAAGETTWTTQTLTGTGTQAVVPDSGATPLVNGTEYEFRVAATNANGTGEWSDSVTSMPAAPPVVNPVLTQHEDGQGRTVLTVEVTGGDPAPSIQWQRWNPASGSWETVSGATEASFTPAESGRYRAVATNIAGTAASNALDITVKPVSEDTTGLSATGSGNLPWAFAATALLLAAGAMVLRLRNAPERR